MRPPACGASPHGSFADPHPPSSRSTGRISVPSFAFDAVSARRLQQSLIDVLRRQPPGDIDVDVSGVTFLDAAGKPIKIDLVAALRRPRLHGKIADMAVVGVHASLPHARQAGDPAPTTCPPTSTCR